MAKRIASKPDWLKSNQVKDIYSVSSCTSEDFCDYINYWKHNGYWLFDSPGVIREVAEENDIDLDGTTLFYYEAYELQSYEDEPIWEEFSPEESFSTNVVSPKTKQLIGYDVVSFTACNAPECSYLSCNHMAEKIEVNEHCLIESFERAKELINQKAFIGCEPGPCRIFAVYTVENV
ncbi:MAG: hypothetical protein ABW157_02215 [Candidatus Thiodiazotropha sp. LLP2]